jgi:diguanylate cyclase (GGDEF)-like protein
VGNKKKENKTCLEGQTVAELLDRVSEYVIVLDSSLHITLANRAFRDAVMKKGVASFRDTVEEPCLAYLDRNIISGSPTRKAPEDIHLTVTHCLREGGRQKVHYKLFPLDSGQEMIGAVGRVLRFPEAASAETQLIGRRATDGEDTPEPSKSAFGDVLSRGDFFEEAEKGVRSASRYRYPISCLALDIDNLMSVNEQMGNAVGDFVIEKMAGILQGQVRQSDLVGKYEGDEFVILAPHTDRVNARFLAERLRRRVQEMTIEKGDDEVSVTISIGVATLQEATGVAGEELREAQQRGMNRVVIYE